MTTNEPWQTVIAKLSELRELLAMHKVRPWVEHLDSVLAEGEFQDFQRLKDAVLCMYGGMGSLTDLIVCRVNGHHVDDEKAANDHLARLTHELWIAAKQL